MKTPDIFCPECVTVPGTMPKLEPRPMPPLFVEPQPLSSPLPGAPKPY